MKNQVFTKRKLQQGIVQYALVTLIILGLGGYFGYKNYTEYQAANAAQEIGAQKLGELKASADKTKQEYLALKKDMDIQNSGVNESIEKILPSNEDFTNLARELDKYFLNTKITLNPMFLSDLRFSQPNVSTDTDFALLPFSMNVSGDETGFKELLNYIEKSGDLNDRSRLLSISTINLSYQQPETTDSSTDSGTSPFSFLNQVRNISASMTMNAYFQKPVDTGNSAN